MGHQVLEHSYAGLPRLEAADKFGCHGPLEPLADLTDALARVGDMPKRDAST